MTPFQPAFIPGLSVYQGSVTRAGEATIFVARRGTEKLVCCLGASPLASAQVLGMHNGQRLFAGPPDAANARAVRAALPHLAPQCLGLATSAGFGDRLGLATPGHIRALRAAGRGMRAVLAQQSVRELSRTGRTPQEVIDAATWGALQEGFTEGFGADADHLQRIEDIDPMVAGYTLFTIDPGMYVIDAADEMDPAALANAYAAMEFASLETSAGDLERSYVGRRFALSGGGEIRFDGPAFLRAAVKYGRAIAHTAAMHRRLCQAAKGEFELEVSVDETASPTSAAEHYFFAAELRRLGGRWVSMAPRFIGRFEKGVDYIGDLDAFRANFAQHVAVMRTLGPYKISIHSGSDKFSIYPIVAELTEGLVHLKTAGTSYLEALRVLAGSGPGLFREILDFARRRYNEDRKTYHVSADAAKVPPGAALSDAELPRVLDDFDARQVLHVTFGSVLSAFGERLREALAADEEAHYQAVASHLARHLSALCGGQARNGKHDHE